MKKLLLLSFLFLINPYAEANMDRICSFKGNAIGGFDGYLYLEDSCQRNNIFEVKKIRLSEVTFLVNSYCRFDRNVYVQEIKQPQSKRVLYDLGCVLYAPEGRSRD